MDGHRTPWSGRRKWNFLKRLRRLKDARLARRYLIVYHLLGGARPTAVARMVGCSRSTVGLVWQRFRREGEAGLVDRREDNGEVKVDDAFLARLRVLVHGRPGDFGWRRPTWTRHLLIEQTVRDTGVRVSPATMSRALKAIGARRGRPRPVVNCPWSNRRRDRRLKAIRDLVARLPADEVAVWADEADIDLNPKIGPDWMLRGEQKDVVTPGQNVKRYVAGALDDRTGRLTWVFGERKTSVLFAGLLWRLRETYSQARVIHVMLDNARLHTSRYTRATVACMEGRVVLHFLPPYCPNDNRIERVWEDLHNEVTRNHQRATIEDLMRDVYYFLYKRNRRAIRQQEARRNEVRVPA
jgi:transposase